MNAVEQLAPEVGTVAACRALAVARATIYRCRTRNDSRSETPAARSCVRRLADEERQRVLDVLHSERFVDTAPAEVYATLLDEATYLCSERTMYRILAADGAVRERRDQLRHPSYRKPELLATGANQVWSWDITKLRGPVKWSYFYLYVILDIFSRYVVGWMVAQRESATLAKRLIAETCEKQGITEAQLTIHADRGPSMRSKLVAQLLADLSITKSHSRPYCSNDNPFSESQFKTLKYRPEFPDRFGSSEDARGFCRPFFHWYNCEHRHSGIAMLTPYAVHYGLAEAILEQRRRVLEAAYRSHPERFVHGLPKPAELPAAAWINPPQSAERGDLGRIVAEVDIHKRRQSHDLDLGQGVDTPENCDFGSLAMRPSISGELAGLHTKLETRVSQNR